MKLHRTRGRNLVWVGWEGGILAVTFANGGQYRYTGVPEAEFNKLLNSPFPDRLYSTNIKGKYPVEKIAEGKTKAQRVTEEASLF